MKDNENNRKLLEKAVYLYKIAFSNAAQSCGAKVRYVSQHSIIWGAMGAKGFDPDFWLGVCAGLSIEWIKAKINGGDVISDLAAARNDVFAQKSDNRQFLEAIVGDIQGSHYLQNNLSRAFQGVCFPDGDNVSSLYPFDSACSKMKKGNYYYISSGSHAMAAAFNGTNDIDFYDPNVGEMCGISKIALQRYLKEAVDGSCLAQGISVDSIKGTKYMSVVGFHS